VHRGGPVARALDVSLDPLGGGAVALSVEGVGVGEREAAIGLDRMSKPLAERVAAIYRA
jgi:hypothetical protein